MMKFNKCQLKLKLISKFTIFSCFFVLIQELTKVYNKILDFYRKIIDFRVLSNHSSILYVVEVLLYQSMGNAYTE